VSYQFASERAEFEQERKDFKEDIRRCLTERKR
jgi:hypothetical protein